MRDHLRASLRGLQHSINSNAPWTKRDNVLRREERKLSAGECPATSSRKPSSARPHLKRGQDHSILWPQSVPAAALLVTQLEP
eukprot:830485-Rhodomonas_salina.2